jgi:hypothetical protein
VGLLGRFRLGGMVLGLLLCAALWIWRNTASFPPPAPAASLEHLAGRTSHSGLLTLLRRHIRPADLPSVCWKEWIATNRVRPDVAASASEILRTKADPVAQMAALSQLLPSPARGTPAKGLP